MKLNLEELKLNGEAAEWHTDESIKTLENGYLLEGETPRAMYRRIAKAVALRLKKEDLEEKFFQYMWKGWLGPASPVCANMGTERGLPISCYSVFVGDSVNEIMGSMSELAALSKHGGGVGMHWNDVRPRGSEISNGNGKSDGVIPFLKIQDSTTIGISQGGVRRGASAAYLPVEHGDVDEFLKMRRPQGDTNRQCLNIHHGVNITDAFMKRVVDEKDPEARSLWVEIMKTRYETGEPYLFFSDNVDRNRPEIYKKLGLDVKGSNICCVSGDTLVLTKEGPQRIDSLTGKTVEIWDGENWVINNTFSQRGVDKLIRIKISDGSHIDSNANHRWFVSKNAEEFCAGIYNETHTKDLKIGQWIECHNIDPVTYEYTNQNLNQTEYGRIISIENLSGEYPVYCPTLPSTGKFALANGLMTGNTEIFLHTDKDHSFVCCLSSLNLAKYDEWKDTDVMYYSIWFLDGVMQEFIEKAKTKPGFERAVRFAEKSRALGLGVLGFHTLLQKRMLPYDSFDTFMLNAEIFRNLDKETRRASEDLAKEYGEPEWCKGFGVRNTHRIALAPTVSNSTISGNVSPSIEPWTANSFAKKSAKGTFIHRNKELEVILEAKGKNTEAVWASIVGNLGSVQHLDFLSKQEKDVFLTAREINQFVIIKLAGQRQRWIDQGQSINLFFPSNVDPKYFHEVHVMAWKEGLNTLYYCRTSSPLKGDAGSREYDRKTVDGQEAVVDSTPYSRSASECVACEG